MHLKWLLLALAIAVASGIVAYFLSRVVARGRPLLGWEDALELRRALNNAGRASLPFDAYVSVRSLIINLTLDGRGYRLGVARTLIYFEARDAPVYEEQLPQLWRAWGNGTHAGAISFMDVSDDGLTVTIRYVRAAAGRTSSICLTGGTPLPITLSSRQSGSVQLGATSYSWRGPRTVKIVELKVAACG